MMKLSTCTRNLIHLALILMVGFILLTASTASATQCDEYEHLHAETDYDKKAHKHLDIACREHWFPISCEPRIGGRGDRYNGGRNILNQEVIAINEAHTQQFSERHGADHEGLYGCHFRANNFLTIFTGHKIEWKLGGSATCVPERCVHVDEAHWYHWDSRHVDLF